MTQKTYRDYPENYLHAVEHFSDISAPELTLEMNLRSAQAVRRDLYRFFAVLSEGEDETSVRLFPIARDLSVSVRPQDVDSEAEVTLTIYRNPLTRVNFLGATETPTVVVPEEKKEKEESGDIYSLDEIEAAMKKKRKKDD